MLRRKLLLILFLLAGLLLTLAVIALISLQALVAQLDHINTQANALVNHCNQLNSSLSTIEVELYQVRADHKRHLDAMIEEVQQAQSTAQIIQNHYVLREAGIQDQFTQMHSLLQQFAVHVGALATTHDPQLIDTHTLQSINLATQLRSQLFRITNYAHHHAQEEQNELTHHFRMLVLGLAIGFLLVINLSLLLLLRAATLVLRPVEQLVEASRQLAQEHFDYRIQILQKDEFQELADAYNSLAQQLQTNEQRKIQTLGQLALTLNHELNNVIAIIELQLALLQRHADDPIALQKNLTQIHDNLQRMAKTVHAVKNVRRIVLTDYLNGEKMLDLQRSTAPDDPPSSSPPPPPPSTPPTPPLTHPNHPH